MSETATTNSESSDKHISHVATGATINLAGNVVRILILYAFTFMLARMLTREELGAYFLMVSIIGMVGLASGIGLPTGVVRFIALYAGEGRNDFVRQTLRAGLIFGAPAGIAGAAAIFILAPFLEARMFSQTPEAITFLRVFAIAIPLLVAARVFNATTQGLHRMQYQVYSRDMGEQGSKLGLSTLLLLLGAGLFGVVIANVISVVIAVLLSLLFALIILPASHTDYRTPERYPYKGMLKFSLPLAFSTIFVTLLMQVDKLLVGVIGGEAEVALYGVALNVALFGAKIDVALGTVFSPMISDLWNRRCTRELQELFKTTTRWIFIFSWPIFLVVAIFAAPILDLFGGQFREAAAVLVLLALGQLIGAAAGNVGLMVLMAGKSHLELANVVASLVVNVVLCFLLIPPYGIMGAAVANATAAALINILRAIEVWFIMRMHAYDPSYLKPVGAGIAGGAMVMLANRFLLGTGSALKLLSLVLILLFIYLVLIIIMGLNERDKAVIRAFRRRLGLPVRKCAAL